MKKMKRLIKVLTIIVSGVLFSLLFNGCGKTSSVSKGSAPFSFLQFTNGGKNIAVSGTNILTLKFNKPVDPSTILDSNLRAYESGAAPSTAYFSYSGDSTDKTLIHASSTNIHTLISNKNYVLDISGGLKSTDGTVCKKQSIPFTTGSGFYLSSATFNSASNDLLNNEKNCDISGVITLTFNKDVNPNSVTGAVSIYKGTDTTSLYPATGSGKQVTITIPSGSSSLTPNTMYTINVVSSLVSSGDNIGCTLKSFSFTTKNMGVLSGASFNSRQLSLANDADNSGCDVSGAIVLNFDKNIDPDQTNLNNGVKLVNSDNPNQKIIYSTSGKDSQITITISPTTPLLAGNFYNINISDKLKLSGGIISCEPYSVVFKTKSKWTKYVLSNLKIDNTTMSNLQIANFGDWDSSTSGAVACAYQSTTDGGIDYKAYSLANNSLFTKTIKNATLLSMGAGYLNNKSVLALVFTSGSSSWIRYVDSTGTYNDIDLSKNYSKVSPIKFDGSNYGYFYAVSGSTIEYDTFSGVILPYMASFYKNIPSVNDLNVISTVGNPSDYHNMGVYSDGQNNIYFLSSTIGSQIPTITGSDFCVGKSSELYCTYFDTSKHVQYITFSNTGANGGRTLPPDLSELIDPNQFVFKTFNAGGNFGVLGYIKNKQLKIYGQGLSDGSLTQPWTLLDVEPEALDSSQNKSVFLTTNGVKNTIYLEYIDANNNVCVTVGPKSV